MKMAGEGVSFRSFVSETELDEKRRQRQEEWEKVRTADQPLECPEEDVDPRSLYDKLQEQKDKKQTDFDEQFKFKNMVRGIDEDESKFLDEVADRQMEIETKRLREEKDMLEEMKKYTRVVPATEPNVKLTNRPLPTAKMTASKTVGASSVKRTQASLLAGVVKRKRSESDDRNGEKKGKTAIASAESLPSRNEADSLHGIASESHSASTHTAVDETTERTLKDDNDRAQVVSILPGLGFYSNSSDSDTSSSDSEVDLLNSAVRKPSKKKRHMPCH